MTGAAQMTRSRRHRQNQVKWSKKLHRTIANKLDGRTIPSLSHDNHLLLTCASLANARDHAMATTLLIEYGCDGSALALQRVCFEAMVRGLWLYELATPKWTDDPANARQSRKYLEDASKDEFPRINTMLECMETSIFLNIFKHRHLNEWNSYTHGGMKQLLGKISTVGLEVNYSDADISEALTLSDLCFIISSIFTVKLCGDSELAETYVRDFIGNNKWLTEWETEKFREA